MEFIEWRVRLTSLSCCYTSSHSCSIRTYGKYFLFETCGRAYFNV